VLLVEDEDPVRALAHEMLTSQGYRVLEAASGADALALAARHPGAIDLLVTDVVMPGMDGGELVHHLTTARPHLRVLYISGYSDDALMREGVSEADCAFLQKPFTCEAFVVKVRAVLDAPQPRRAAA
jgi:CheY-like chemotaxis protein